MIDVGREQVIFFGFSANILSNLTESLPAGSVLVFEEPDVVRKRDMHTLALGFPMVSRVVEYEYQKPDALEELILDSAELRNAAAIVPGVEYGVTAAATVAEALGLPGAGTVAGRVFRDKHALRDLAATAGIANPRYALVDTPEQAQAFFDTAGGPCVLKPTGRQASLGVQIVHDRDEIAAGWALSTDIAEGRVVPDRGIESRVMIETAVLGAEYSVEVLVVGGEVCFANVTAKDVLRGRFPVETGHTVPAPVAGLLGDRLVDRTVALSKAAGFGAGILHCEWIVAGEEPTLVECAARMPGDEIPKLLALAYGFPLVEAYIETLFGRVPAAPSRAAQGSAIRFLTAPAGVVTAVAGQDAAAAIDGVDTVKVTVAEGSEVRSATSSWDRAGYVIAVGTDAVAAAGTAAKAAEAITVSTRPHA